MRPHAGPAGAGLRDDCAILEPECPQLAVTTDAHVEGVHFDPRLMSWRDIGYRALAACLSDLGAAGADGRPAFLVALGVPGELEADAVAELYSGMRELMERTTAQLIGGDTVASDRMFISVTALAAARHPMRRTGARPGDLLFVSGRPGSAAAALQRLQAGERDRTALAAFLRPLPRLELGQALARLGATACADISDGLGSELRAIAQGSRVGIAVDEDLLPPVAGLSRPVGVQLAYTGGEDFELVFTAPAARRDDILRLSSDLCPITVIGEVHAAEGVTARSGGRPTDAPPPGYQHHRGGGS